MRRAPLLATAGAACLLLAACSSAGGAAPQSWVPSQVGGQIEGPGGQLTPILPYPSPDPSRTPGAPPPAPSTPPSSSNGSGKIDPAVVATHLVAPVGLTLLPDGSALVGERTTGRIVQVQPQPGLPVPTVRTLTGLDTSGDGGLLDLALSPTYSQDNLIYAYITTPTDNRVVDFTLHGPVTPVLTGIPKGRTGNTGRIAFGPHGDLYVGTGDAGNPSLAANPRSLAGKVLRVDDIGDPATGRSPVWTSGHQVVDGLCPVPRSTTVYEVEPPDEVNSLDGGGVYGPGHPATATLPAADRSPGGCAVLGGRLWVTSLDGQSLLSAPISGAGAIGSFTAALVRKYGRLRTVVAAPDGALWLTTSNRDGHGRPVPADERVIRFVPSGGGAGGSPV
ncbi:MAG TPA: PQQ-dependent sugar dehydrogenase [Jatrophihabitans sp.]|nr:PQQ-dependent sugar dehydrogenase [Jatrophihabitans sp.]